jgi:hypothetical protein
MIANNKQIREELIARWTKMGLLHTIADKRYYSEIVTDAEERAPWMKITGDRLSKWLLGKPAGPNGFSSVLACKSLVFRSRGKS